MEKVTYICFDVSECNGEEKEFGLFLKTKYPNAKIEYENSCAHEIVKLENDDIENTIYESAQGFLNHEWECYCQSPDPQG